MKKTFVEAKNLTVSYKISRSIIESITDNEVSRRLKERYERAVWKIKRFIERREVPDKIIKNINEVLERILKGEEIKIHAINQLDLETSEGKILSVIGESDSGKSTLALALLGIIPVNADIKGVIKIDGRNILKLDYDALNELRKQIVYLGEGNKIDPNIHLRYAPKIEIKTPFLKEIKSENLSIQHPQDIKLLIVDGLFKSLSTYQASNLARSIRRIVDEYNITTIIFTDKIDIALEISDEIAVLYMGSIVEKGPASKIYRNPIHPYTKGLIGAIPDIRYPKKELIYIPGERLPNELDIDFCVFYNRCPVKRSECLDKKPPLEKINGREIACYASNEIKDLEPSEFWGGRVS